MPSFIKHELSQHQTILPLKQFISKSKAYHIRHTSSIRGESLFSWVEEDELGKMVPLPKLDTKTDVGTEPLQASFWRAKFCWLTEVFCELNFELSSLIRELNSSILSFRVDICSDSWLTTSYRG